MTDGWDGIYTLCGSVLASSMTGKTKHTASLVGQARRKRSGPPNERSQSPLLPNASPATSPSGHHIISLSGLVSIHVLYLTATITTITASQTKPYKGQEGVYLRSLLLSYHFALFWIYSPVLSSLVVRSSCLPACFIGIAISSLTPPYLGTYCTIPREGNHK